MNKAEFIANVAAAAGVSKTDAAKVLNAVVENITVALKKGEKVQLVGFGTFEVRERGERVGRNPQSGAEIKIAASKVPAFKAGKALKDAIK